jgi:hypothetical protein
MVGADSVRIFLFFQEMIFALCRGNPIENPGGKLATGYPKFRLLTNGPAMEVEVINHLDLISVGLYIKVPYNAGFQSAFSVCPIFRHET